MPKRFYAVSMKAATAAVSTMLNGGQIRVYTGPQPALNAALTGTLLVTLGFSSTAFAAPVASGGLVTAQANTITPGVAGASGAPSYFALLTSAFQTVMTGSVGVSGADLNIGTTSIAAGGTVSASSYTLMLPQTGP